MAGIAGFYNFSNPVIDSQKILKSMIDGLSFSDRIDLQSASNNNYGLALINPALYGCTHSFRRFDDGVIIAYEGYILAENSNAGLLAHIYESYKDRDIDFLRDLSGSFNLVILDIPQNRAILANDKLGLYPLYYYTESNACVFASKIDSIIGSGIIENLELDNITVFEHLLFHYPLSDYTFLREVKTLAPASCLICDNAGIKLKTYWNFSELLVQDKIPLKRSLTYINDSLHKSIDHLAGISPSKINFSLTGGWDSRVVLSFLMNDKQRINCYSFGSKHSTDITIPTYISNKEKIKYTPIILDDNYLNSSFVTYAKQTVDSSGGMRNYKRAHYLYAIEQVSKISPIVMTGIFGDEVFKLGRAQGGAVFSENLSLLIDEGLDAGKLISHLCGSVYSALFQDIDKNQIDRLVIRINESIKHLQRLEKPAQYAYLRFMLNLRKYFGYEASSYNDYAYICSPFIDVGFLKDYFSTQYSIDNYDFEPSTLLQKKQSTDLYYMLVANNHKSLTRYMTGRGYSMADSQSSLGKLKILYAKYRKRLSNTSVDNFNTSKTDSIFSRSALSEDWINANQMLNNASKMFETKADALSLIYWFGKRQLLSI